MPGNRREKGNERRRQVLAATKELLSVQPLEDITLSDIASATGIPVSSLYHFYPKILDVYRELAVLFSVELSEYLMCQLSTATPQNWQQLLDEAIDSCAKFYQVNPAYQQLILSGRAPAQVKSADREGDAQLASALITFIAKFFAIPPIPQLEDIFFSAIEMIDLFLSLSVMKHAHITPSAIQEAKRASRAYLRTYLPDVLYPQES